MYTSYIGRKFLAHYKVVFKKPDDYSAKVFFMEEFFPLFFTDESHLMHVGNSPFFQGPTKEAVKAHGSKSLAQLHNFTAKAESGVPSGAIFVGFAAEGRDATTSGQLTTMDFQIDEEEIYCSWIGEALGIGVNGGFIMLIDEIEILEVIYKGWNHYRKFLSQTPDVKDKQIETWNGNWIINAIAKEFDFNRVNYSHIHVDQVVGKLAITTSRWSRVLFALAKRYPKRTLTAYCYGLSQTNTTLGFINIYLPQVRLLYDFRDKVFINAESGLKDPEIEALETFYNFRSACMMGTIGLRSLEPAKLREFMPTNSMKYAQGKDMKFSDEASFLTYKLFKLWIIAMLNKTELLAVAEKFATALIEFESEPDSRGKTELTRLAKDVRESTNVKQFISQVTSMLDRRTTNVELLKEVVVQVVTMPADSFPFFATLIRFEYAFQKHKSSNPA